MICFTRPSSKLIVSLSFSMAVTVPSPNCGWDTRSSIAKPDASGMGSFDTGGPAAIFCLFRAGLCGRLLRCRAWHRSPSSTAQMADLDLLVGIANDAARCPYATATTRSFYGTAERSVPKWFPGNQNQRMTLTALLITSAGRFWS
jgi:hypothetical protein